MSTAIPGSAKPILILGLGNLLLTDDGFGPILLERLRSRWPDHPEVEFVDGGTLGMSLLGQLSDRRAVLLLDAYALGETPGTLRLCRNIGYHGAGAGRGRSAHEGNAATLLAAAALTGNLPPRVDVIGIEPGHIATGVGLTSAVDARLAEAEEAARQWIAELTGVAVCA